MSRLEDKILDFIVSGRSVRSEPLDKDILNDPAFDQDLFNDYQKIWDLADGLKEHKQANLDEAWQAIAVEAGIAEEDEEDEEGEAKRVPLWRRLSIAASFLVLVGAVLYFYWPRDHYIITPVAEVSSEISLPDGSVASLEPGSSIRYLKDARFLEDTARIVYLTGEAIFDVEYDPDKPFRVETELTSIDVLGTRFRYKVEGRSSEAENMQGQVEFGVKSDGQKQVMNPGDIVKYPGEGKLEFIEWAPPPPPPPTNNVRVDDLMHILAERFQENFIPSSSLNRRNQTVVKVNLNLQDLESILQSLDADDDVNVDYHLYRGRNGYFQVNSIEARDVGLQPDYSYNDFLVGLRYKTQSQINEETGYVEGKGFINQ